MMVLHQQVTAMQPLVQRLTDFTQHTTAVSWCTELAYFKK